MLPKGCFVPSDELVIALLVHLNSLFSPIVITQIQWRPDIYNGGPIANCTISNIQINFSTTTRNADQLSSVFAQNTGTNEMIVFNGTLVVGTSFTTLINGTKAFDINVPLQTPFTYDPSKGNLLIDLRNFTGGTATLSDNSTGDGSDAVSRIFSSDANATTAGAVDTGGGVIQITYTSVSASPFVTTQPTNQNTLLGGNPIFTIAIISSLPVYYQWFFNDLTSPIAEATNSSLSLVNVQINQAGTWFVRVTNSNGLTLSPNAPLSGSSGDQGKLGNRLTRYRYQTKQNVYRDGRKWRAHKLPMVLQQHQSDCRSNQLLADHNKHSIRPNWALFCSKISNIQVVQWPRFQCLVDHWFNYPQLLSHQPISWC